MPIHGMLVKFDTKIVTLIWKGSYSHFYKFSRGILLQSPPVGEKNDMCTNLLGGKMLWFSRKGLITEQRGLQVQYFIVTYSNIN